ncbi:MAG: hypothetical protein JSV55_13245 [Deltaproteobacteria bacterium]|nr:MAG: hypothetical protein JSV55_13245 [Deltaproteobacteria bacterium]
MLLSDWYELLYGMLKEQYSVYALNGLFDVPQATHEKVIYYLTNLILEEDPAHLHDTRSRETDFPRAWKREVLGSVVNMVAFALTFAKYTLLYFFYRYALRGRKSTGGWSGNADFVLINSAGGIDRLVDFAEELFAHKPYRMVYLVTGYIRKLIERKRKHPDLGFIEPRMPAKDAFRVGLVFLFSKGSGFCFQIFHRLPFRSLRKRLLISLKILNYLYSMVIYHHWAWESAERLLAEHNAAVFVFDIDEASKELMLADALNRRGAFTLLLQHGIMTDPNRYVPTCRWMACASERERQALISLGVNKNRLVAVGQSLQTLEDSAFREVDGIPRYPLLILAGNGPEWLQNCYLDMLRQSKQLVRSSSAYVRLHPGFRRKAKRKWSCLNGIRMSDRNESLGQSLARSDLVITFSIDALVASVRQERPTICCVPDKYFVPDWHGFLYDLPGVRVARSAAMLDGFLADRAFAGTALQRSSPFESAKLDYAFGLSDTVKNVTALLKGLRENQMGTASSFNN